MLFKKVEGPAFAPLQASKWQQLQLLLDAEEMESLFQEMGIFTLVKVGAIIPLFEAIIPPAAFLGDYRSYIESLQRGELPDLKHFSRRFSVVATRSLDALAACRIEEERYLIKMAEPVVQVQAHAIHYSLDEQKFRSMVFGFDSITWGLQFAYPLIYQDPKTMEIEKVSDQDRCPNTQLFQAIRQWQRSHTLPTPFVVGGKKTNVPMRIGKHCLSWINRHPQLVSRQIGVSESQ